MTMSPPSASRRLVASCSASSQMSCSTWLIVSRTAWPGRGGSVSISGVSNRRPSRPLSVRARPGSPCSRESSRSSIPSTPFPSALVRPRISRAPADCTATRSPAGALRTPLSMRIAATCDGSKFWRKSYHFRWRSRTGLARLAGTRALSSALYSARRSEMMSSEKLSRTNSRLCASNAPVASSMSPRGAGSDASATCCPTAIRDHASCSAICTTAAFTTNASAKTVRIPEMMAGRVGVCISSGAPARRRFGKSKDL